MLEKYILRTPLIPYGGYDPDNRIYLKPENLQIFGSYKIRGIATAIKAADPLKLKNGLVTISAGNMAQTVAFVARELKIPCKIFIPNTAPVVKKEAIRKLGAEIIELSFEEIWEMVKSDNLDAYDGVLIHPVFTPGILEGYGNIAKEIIEDLSVVDAIVIPFGVGGLTSGIAKTLKKLKPDISIYTCEPTTASPLQASLKAGRSVMIERHPSFIDAIGTPEVLTQVYDNLKNIVKESITVTPNEAMCSLANLLMKNKLLCEGAAAVSLAAALKISERGNYRKIVCILSGGNISPEVIQSLTADKNMRGENR
jgi:threonine dehydratase